MYTTTRVYVYVSIPRHELSYNDMNQQFDFCPPYNSVNITTSILYLHENVWKLSPPTSLIYKPRHTLNNGNVIASKHVLVFDTQIKTRCVKRLKYTCVSKYLQFQCKGINNVNWQSFTIHNFKQLRMTRHLQHLTWLTSTVLTKIKST